MKKFGIIITVLVIANLMAFQFSIGQDLENGGYSHRLKSEKKALSYSLLGTVLPVSAGIIWWAVDGRPHAADLIFHPEVEIGVITEAKVPD